ncbi:MAG: hypothetical protein HY958_00810 [Bacteroidia bacterium]|nr:hypothetical protein [Bacteroidia bacterium]
MRSICFGLIGSVIFIISACNSSVFKKGINEGVIHYNITYIKGDKDNPIIEILPEKTTIKFKNNSSCAQFKGFLGFFETTYISNFSKKTNSCLFKALDKKIHLETKFNEPSLGLDDLPNLKLQKTNDTKIIAGYKCKRVFASYGEAQKDTFSIYYTDDILIYNPNWNNPFKEIQGVLMEFRGGMMKIQMKCIASKVEEVKIADSEFQVPAGYKNVSREEFEKILNNLMKNN